MIAFCFRMHFAFVLYELRSGLIFRITTDRRGVRGKQLVVLYQYRREILRLYHEGGRNNVSSTKTKPKILQHYFVPEHLECGNIREYMRSLSEDKRKQLYRGQRTEVIL